MKYEHPRPGNPNQLTIAQHVFPKSAISRFANDRGLVQVQRLAGGAAFGMPPGASIFCAQRVWDQMTETVRSRDIENAYAALANRIVAGDVTSLSAGMDDIVTRFYGLWNQRHLSRKSPFGDTEMRGVRPEPPLTKEQEENLESNGYVFARGTAIPGRMMTGLSMMVRMNRFQLANQGVHWGIVRSDAAQFLVPDNSMRLRYVPVSPAICLCQDSDDVTIAPHGVALANRLAVDEADSYYFANDLERCPIIRRTIPLDLSGRDAASTGLL